MLFLILLLAGALLYAVISYCLSFESTPFDVYHASAADRPTVTPPSNAESLINLNTATQEELETLPGIGEKTAQAIIAMRAQLGGYRYKEELMLIYGMGEKKLDAIYDLIYVK